MSDGRWVEMLGGDNRPRFTPYLHREELRGVLIDEVS